MMRPSLSALPKPTAQRPDPWLAVNYSMLMPGLGQVYSGHRLKGGVMIGGTIALISYAVWAIFGATGNTVTGLWTIALTATLYGFGILDAYRSTQPDYRQRISIPKEPQNAWYGVFLSQVLPGLGQMYGDHAVLGGVLLVAGVGTAWLANDYPQLLPIAACIWAMGCYHAYLISPQASRGGRGAIALLVLGVFILRLSVGSVPGWIKQAVEQCIVPSESMLPTLQVGDRLFVTRQVRYQPSVGEIVVFLAPPAAQGEDPRRDRPTLFVKRVIGLPGQQVQITNGRVYINRQPLNEPYIQAPPAYEWGPAVIPAESYMVLGDNRNASSDSHVWGFVPAQNLLGPAYKIYWPPSRIQPLEGGIN